MEAVFLCWSWDHILGRPVGMSNGSSTAPRAQGSANSSCPHRVALCVIIVAEVSLTSGPILGLNCAGENLFSAAGQQQTERAGGGLGALLTDFAFVLRRLWTLTGKTHGTSLMSGSI